jgi:hypothetical protein
LIQERDEIDDVCMSGIRALDFVRLEYEPEPPEDRMELRRENRGVAVLTK